MKKGTRVMVNCEWSTFHGAVGTVVPWNLAGERTIMVKLDKFGEVNFKASELVKVPKRRVKDYG